MLTITITGFVEKPYKSQYEFYIIGKVCNKCVCFIHTYTTIQKFKVGKIY